MGRKNKYPAEAKEQAVKDYLSGRKSVIELANDLLVSTETIYKWVEKYQACGIEAFFDKARNKAYSKALKEAAIQDYLEGKGSLTSICIKHDISSHSVLREWINSYNRHEPIKEYNPKGAVYMAKARKTSLEERQEIVAYCIKHHNDYKGTAEIYHLSYAQVYQWVKKYHEMGDEGLVDKRGQRKPVEVLSHEEQLERRVKQLERQLELKERENILLKKVKEIERRRYSPSQNKK